MNSTHLPKPLQKTLQSVQFATLSTVCADRSPWGTPVEIYFDDQLNAYWASWTKNQHSINIAQCPKVFITMFDPSTKDEEAKGIYIQAAVTELNEPKKIREALKHYKSSIGETQLTDLQYPHPRRIYKAALYKIWTNTWATHNGYYIDLKETIQSSATQR